MQELNEVQGLLINQSLEACRDYIAKAKKEDAEKGEKYTYKIRARGSRSSAEVYDYGFDQLEKYFAKTGKKTIDLSPDEVQREMGGIRRRMAQSIPLSLGKTFTVYRYKYVKENVNETPNQKTFDQLMTGHVAVVNEAEIDTSVVIPIDNLYESIDKLRTFNEFLTEGILPKNLPKEFSLLMKELGLTYASAESIYVQDPYTQTGINAHWVKKGNANVVSKHHDDLLNKLKTSKFKQHNYKSSRPSMSQSGVVHNQYRFIHNATGALVSVAEWYDANPSSKNKSSVTIILQPGEATSNSPDEIDMIIGKIK